MMRPRQHIALMALCGTVAFAGSGAAKLAGSSSIETTATPVGHRAAMRGATFASLYADRVDAALPPATTFATTVATSYLRLPEPAAGLAAVSIADAVMSIADAATAVPATPEPSVAPATASTAEATTAEAMTAEAGTADATTAEPAPSQFTLASVATSVAEAAADANPTKPAVLVADASGEVPIVEAASPESDPAPQPATRVKLASLFTAAPVNEEVKPVVRPVALVDECLVLEVCIDEYLWALYERTPKIDTNKVIERIKVTVKRKGKIRTVTKAITKYVLGDFTWKDPIAAKRVGMSLKDYVIGGMDRSFKVKLFRSLRAMDEAGLMPGITSAFRDDYRQAIAVGKKAASDSSFHGGSRRGGYGHGLAVDLVSVRGHTRNQRFASTIELWKWVDANEKQFGVGRPYLHRDPPHVGPIDGREFLAKRGGGGGGGAKVQKAGLKTRTARKAAAQTKTAQKAGVEAKKRQVTARTDAPATKSAKPAKSAKVSSLQDRTRVQR